MRISREEWGLRLAEDTAELGTCIRRKVGCVLVDAGNRVIGTGYNGSPRGEKHCNEMVSVPTYGPEQTITDWVDDEDRKGKRKLETWTTRQVTGFKETYPNTCAGASAASGTGLSICEAVHAEINALIQCKEPGVIDTVYLTASPCEDCVKALMNTNARRVVFREEYPHPVARERWLRSGWRKWDHLPK